MAKNKKVAFNSLKKLSLRKRLAVAQDPQIGPSLLSALTPTQYAELFPKYYQRGLPDVGGFQAAITKKSQEKQQAVNQGVENLATAGTNSENPEIRDWSNNYLNEKLQRQSGELTGTGRTGKQYQAPANANEMQKAIVREANKLGISPTDLATMMHYESAGSMSTSKWGGKGGNYMGLIQFGPAERKQFGVYEGQSFDSQMESVGKFLESRGLKRWMDAHPNATDQEKRYALYSTINAGRPEENYWHRGDRPGYSVIRHVDEMFTSGHHSYAVNLMSGTKETTVSGEQTAALNKEQSTRWDSITPRNATSQGECGKGVRNLAAQVFGDNYFNKGLGEGGSAQASSLTRNNDYLIKSGYYGRGNTMSAAEITKEFYDSLPPGAVVAFSGGNSSGDGHVQMKVGGRWVSDFAQRGFWARPPEQYGQATIYYPNQEGQKVMAQRGLMDAAPAPSATVTTPPRTQTVSASPVTNEKAEPKLDPQSGERVAKTEAPVKQAPPAPAARPEVQQTAAPAPADVPKKEDKGPEVKSFNLNRAGLISAIRQTDEFKNTFGSSLATDDMIHNGFFDDARTKKLMAETKSSYDPNTGVVKIGDYEKFKKSIPDMDTTKFMKPIPSHAGGGREKVTQPIGMVPIPPRRGDDTLVTDAAGKQFTVNRNKETLTVNPNTNMMDIKPHNQQMDLEKMMALIRRQESGKFEGNYSADLSKKSRNTASGAYQYNNKTWKEVSKKYGIGTEYKRAIDAPKEVQDALTKARFTDLRNKGYSDNEIFTTHFTGNRQGRMSKAAAKGNPTPEKYRTAMAEHSRTYDEMRQPKVQAARTAPEPTSANKPFMEKVKTAFNEFVGVPKAEAAPLPKAAKGPMGPTPDNTRSEIAALRNQMTGMDQQAPQEKEKFSFKVERAPDDPNMIQNITDSSKTPFQNPSFYRAMTRTRFQETGDGTNDNHFSTGNAR